MKRAILIVSLALVIPVVLSFSLYSAEEGKKKDKDKGTKVRGNLIPHMESKDIKVLTENYETITVIVNDKTRIEPSVQGNLEDMEKEAEFNLPKGEVTYTLVDGQPVAQRVTYSSKAKWKMTPPKPKED